MPKTTELPEQILETSRAFTETLRMENAVFQAQLNGAIAMTVQALHEMIKLTKDAIAIADTGTTPQGHQNLENVAQQAFADIRKAAVTATASVNEAPLASTVPDGGFDASVLNAVGISYHNAVNAQMQLYVTQQAAATEILTTLLSVVTAALGEAAQKAIGKE